MTAKTYINREKDTKTIFSIGKLKNRIIEYLGLSKNFSTSKLSKLYIKTKKNINHVAIIGTALPVAIIWGLLLYRWISTPRPANLSPLKNDSSYYFAGKSNIYQVRIGDKSTNEPKVEFSLSKSEDKSVVFYPASARTGLEQPTQKGNKITFSNVYPDIDYIYSPIAKGIKEDIVVNKPTTIKAFPFYLDFKGVTPQYLTDNIKGTAFYDENGKYLFNFEKPYALDANGVKTENLGISIQKDSTTGKFVAIVTLDGDWIDAKERIYPITIDPTIVHDETSEFSTGQYNRVTDTGSGSSPSLQTYYQEMSTSISTVGLWHMNEASGNVADSSGNGNTGTANGTTVVSGVVGNARSFNGSSDYVGVSSGFNQITKLSVELWFKTTTTTFSVMFCRTSNLPPTAASSYDPNLVVNTNGTIRAEFWTGAVGSITTTKAYNDGAWHHAALTSDGTSQSFYMDGVFVGTRTGTVANSWWAYTTVGAGYLGTSRGAAANQWTYFNGTIDDVRISNVSLTPEEIWLDAQRRPYSIYTSPVIDLTNTTTWNSLLWSGNGFSTTDGETATGSATSALVAQWNFNETSGTTAVSGGTCGTSCNGTLTNFASTGSQDAAATSGWTSNNKRWGAGALMFDGSNDYLNAGTDSSMNITGEITMETWVNTKQTSSGYLISKRDGNTYQYSLLSSLGAPQILGGGSNNVTGTTYINDGKWHHVVGTISGTTGKVYVDGRLDGQGTLDALASQPSIGVLIGARGNGLGGQTLYLNGVIDAPKIYSRALTANEILSNYNSSRVELQTRVGGSTNADDGTWEAWRPTTSETTVNSMDNSVDWATPSASIWGGALVATSSSTFPIVEGAKSMKIQTGQTTSMTSTVGMWHLDETGGTGAYTKDVSGNGKDITLSGTTLIDGISGKARGFNGSSDYGYVSSAPTTSVTNWSIGAWIKPSNLNQISMAVYNGNDSGGYGFGLGNGSGSSGSKLQALFGNVAWFDCGYTFPSANQWYYVVLTRDSSTTRCYVNGVQTANTSASTPGGVAAKFTVGMEYNSSNSPARYFAGSIDEVRVSNIARPYGEITEDYRLGRDHRISETLSSVDLSSANKLPFYVASDRLGTFMQMTYGESAYANYEADGNTVTFWHLDELSGTGAYLKDASGNGNHATPNSSTTIPGKIGQARYFDGSSYYISSTTSYTSPQSFTLEAWFMTSTAGGKKIVGLESSQTGTGSTSFDRMLYVGSDGKLYFGVYDGAVKVVASPYVVTDNFWHYAVGKCDGSNIYLYLDGVLQATLAIGTPQTYTGYWRIGSYKAASWTNASDGYFTGLIDEVRVSNVVRSADEIRQAYEIGTRTHNITIDFKAKLGAGNLIANTSDTSFTIDATPYGISAMGGNIYLGDKIIVKENYNGTEYVAQGTVNSITPSTGATTVISWDSGSSVPSGGFTVNATVFKWQREYFDITKSLPAQRDAITRLTYRIVDGSQGANIWLDDLRSTTGYLANPFGSTITSSLGNRYFQYRAIESSTDQATSASLTSVTLNYTSNSAPATPSLDSPSNTATNQTLYPALKTTTTDADSDNIQYKIELCTNSGMTTGCQTFDQTSSQTGWSGQNADGNTTYTSGTQATYTIQSALNVATTYYWRSYAKDPAGTNTWSSTQGTPYSFATTHAPNAPIDLLTNDEINPTKITDLTPFFSAYHTDPDGDSADYYQILVNTSSDFSGTIMWDSGKISMPLIASDEQSQNLTYAGSTLSWGTQYYWKIRFWDTNGVPGAYSSAANFTTNYIPNIPTLDLPTNGAINQIFLPVLKTTGTDNDADYLRYKIQLCTNLAMTTGCQTFDQTSSQTGWSGQNADGGNAYTSGTQAVYTIQTNLLVGTTYYWRSYAKDPAGTNTWSSTQVTPYSFTTIPAPLPASYCRIEETPTDSSLTLLWTDNATNENGYEVQRSVDSGSFTTLATGLSANTVSNIDSSISEGHTYQYRVAPYFTNGPTYSSWCTTAKLTLQLGTFSIKGLDLKGLILR